MSGTLWQSGELRLSEMKRLGREGWVCQGFSSFCKLESVTNGLPTST